jgi:hypothetical protein
MASLDVTQTPNPVPVDIPNIVQNLDAQTGPEATPNSFGPSLAGLSQGIDAADQDIQQTIYRGRFEQRQKQQSANELTALNAYATLDKESTGKMMQAEAAGQPINPDDFNAQLSQRIDQLSGTMPNDEARASFMSKATGLGDSLYKQNMASIVRVQQQARTLQAQNVLGQVVKGAQQGTVNTDDAISQVMSIGATAAPSVPAAPQLVEQAKSQVYQVGLTNLVQTHGPAAGAIALRGGYAGSAIDDNSRESGATDLDNSQAIQNSARVNIAQANIDALTKKVLQGQPVSTQDMHAAATELANAQAAPEINTNPPSLTDYIDQQTQKFENIKSGLNFDSPVARVQVAALDHLQSNAIGQIIDKRMNVMPLAQQVDEVQKLEAAYGGDVSTNPNARFTLQANSIFERNRAMLDYTKDTYDPAELALRNPALRTSTSSAIAQVGQAPDAYSKGLAQGNVYKSVMQSFAAQDMMGVTPGQERVLTNAQAQSYADASQTPEGAKNTIQQLQATFGDFASQAAQEVFGKKGVIGGATQLALMKPSDPELWAAAQFKDAKLGEKEYDSLKTSITTNSDFNRYYAGMSIGNLAAPQQRQEQAEGMVQFANYFRNKGMSDKDAVTEAISRTLGAAYVTTSGGNGSTLTLPTGLASNSDVATSMVHRANLAATQLIAGGVQDERGAVNNHILQRTALSQGHWAYDQSSNSLQLLYDTPNSGPTRVLLADGTPLALNADKVKSSAVLVPTAASQSWYQSLFSLSKANGDMSMTPQGTPGRTVIGPGQSLDVDPHSMLPPPPRALPVGPALKNPVPMAQPQASADQWQEGAETTHYGYSDDSTPDTNSTNGVGAFGKNPLSPGVVALSPSLEATTGAQPGAVIEMRDENGNKRLGYFGDRTSQKLTNDRIDLYDPHGSEANGAPFQASKFRVLSKGDPSLKGRKLTAYGEAQLAAMEDDSNE